MSDQNLRFASHAISHVGAVRTLNEDSFLCDDGAGLWAVADGVGGLDAGDEASRRVVEALAAIDHTPAFAAAEVVAGAIRAANERMTSEQRSGGRRMGTTVVAFVARGAAGFVLWVGDSRCYRHRDQELVRLTRDHSRVQELVDARRLTPEEARFHPQRNIITRAVGAEERLEVDMIPVEMMAGDVFVLCTDGLTGPVTDDELAGAIVAERAPDRICGRLVDLALSRDASDNVTVIAVRVDIATEGDV